MAYFTNAIFYVDNTPTDRLWTCMLLMERNSTFEIKAKLDKRPVLDLVLRTTTFPTIADVI